MSGIADYADVLASGLTTLWPTVGDVARKVRGRLVGGTALALHLRHRTSEDLDIMTLTGFSGRAVESAMRSAGHAVSTVEVASNMFHGRVDDVKVDVFTALPTIHEVEPADMSWIQPPVEIDGMPVASPEDIMATKLDAITRRATLRDYIDIYALDESGACSLEEGFAHYCTRNGHDYPPPAYWQMVGLLDEPGVLARDPQHEDIGDIALAHLHDRTPDLMDYLSDASDTETETPPPSTHEVPPHRRARIGDPTD